MSGRLFGKAIVVTLAIVALTLLAYAVRRNSLRPSTDDASIDADVVHIASPVGGKILKIGVVENADVKKGDLLFQIDPLPYEVSVAQATAELRLAQAQLDTLKRHILSQSFGVKSATESIGRAQANLALANRTVERLEPLAASGYVATQELDDAQTKKRAAATEFQQSQDQRLGVLSSVDTLSSGEALVDARQAALQLAKRSLEDTTVTAPGNGRIVGLKVAAGEIVIPSQSLFTLILTDEWFAEANFRETDLHMLQIGDCATVYSVIDHRAAITGHIQGIGSGIASQDSIDLPRSLPYVERSLNWVRVAQRFPVRIKLDNPPSQLMRLGASSIVEVKHGVACH